MVHSLLGFKLKGQSQGLDYTILPRGRRLNVPIFSSKLDKNSTKSSFSTVGFLFPGRLLVLLLKHEILPLE